MYNDSEITPLIAVFHNAADGNLMFSLPASRILSAKEFAQVCCDVIRNAATLYEVEEDVLWAHFEQERINPEVPVRLVYEDGLVTSQHPRSSKRTN